MIGKIIKSKRKAEKLSEDKMAKSLGVSRNTYRRWESDKISFTEAEEVCDRLGLKILIINKEQL